MHIRHFVSCDDFDEVQGSILSRTESSLEFFDCGNWSTFTRRWDIATS
jgi:hypothetical protein